MIQEKKTLAVTKGVGLPINQINKQQTVPKPQQFTTKQTQVKKVASNSNDTFFDKFDKTKKIHKDKVRELKESSRKSSSGIVTSFGKKLQTKKYLAKIYGGIASTSSLVVILGVVLFVLLIDFFNGSPASIPTDIVVADNFYQFIINSQYSTMLHIYQPIVQTIVILSMLSAILMLTPIIYMISSWFVGINNIHSEKKFVVAYGSIIIIGAILLLVSLILLFALGWGPFGPFVYPSQPIA